jgi:hypothetical protein
MTRNATNQTRRSKYIVARYNVTSCGTLGSWHVRVGLNPLGVPLGWEGKGSRSARLGFPRDRATTKLPENAHKAIFPNEATKFFLLNRIVSIGLRAVTRGPPHKPAEIRHGGLQTPRYAN